MAQVDITNTQATILLGIDGKMHLVAMEKETYKVVNELIKRSIDSVIPTGRTQKECREFFGVK